MDTLLDNDDSLSESVSTVSTVNSDEPKGRILLNFVMSRGRKDYEVPGDLIEEEHRILLDYILGLMELVDDEPTAQDTICMFVYWTGKDYKFAYSGGLSWGDLKKLHDDICSYHVDQNA